MKTIVIFVTITLLLVIAVFVARDAAWMTWGDERAITVEFVPKNEGVSYPPEEDKVTLTAHYERTRRILFITEGLLEWGGNVPKLERSFVATRGPGEVFVADIPTHLRSMMGWDLDFLEIRRTGGVDSNPVMSVCRREFSMGFSREKPTSLTEGTQPVAVQTRKDWLVLKSDGVPPTLYGFVI
jgi:hypothetical protein